MHEAFRALFTPGSHVAGNRVWFVVGTRWLLLQQRSVLYSVTMAGPVACMTASSSVSQLLSTQA
jgi:hypothetical protein